VTCICSAREHCCETVPRFIHRVRGFRAMWDGIDASGKLAPALLSLIYLRVAMLVGCGL